MEGDHDGMGESLMEAPVFLLGERAIEIIPGIAFAMTTGEKGSTIVDGLGIHDGRDGIVKIEIALARQLPDPLGQDLGG
jgi:hypothetical protein